MTKNAGMNLESKLGSQWNAAAKLSLSEAVVERVFRSVCSSDFRIRSSCGLGDTALESAANRQPGKAALRKPRRACITAPAVSALILAALVFLLLISPNAHAGPLISESFNSSAADNGPVNGVGWHALALQDGTLSDFTSSTRGADYPSLSRGPSGAGAGGPGYLVMGSGKNVSTVLLWTDSTAALAGCAISDLSFWTRNNSASSGSRIAVRIGEQWHASTKIFNDTTANNDWFSNHFHFDQAAASWRLLNTDTLTLGTPLSTPLAWGPVTAIGLFGEIHPDDGKIRIDEFQVNGYRTNAPPEMVAVNIAPGSNVYSGNRLTLSVTASGPQPFAYQWRRNGTNLTNGPKLNGVAAAELTLDHAEPAHSGTYDVVVSNRFGSRISEPVPVSVEVAAAAAVDLSKYEARGAVSVSSSDPNTLMAMWSDRSGLRYRAQFNLLPGQALLRSLETAPANGAFTTIARDVDAKYRVTLGSRHPKIGWPYIFFDNVDANKPVPVPYLSTLKPKSVRVVSESQSRTRIEFSTLEIGPYRGELTCYLYDGSPFLHFQASMQVDQPWVAYIYDALVYADFSDIAFMNTSGAFETKAAAALEESPGEDAKVIARHRTVMGKVNQGTGTLAVMAPPHTCVYPIDQSDNYGFLQAGRTFIGTKMSYSADRRYRPWVDAPQGAVQRMDSFLFFNRDTPQSNLTNILAYTHGDSFKKIPGHFTMAEHFHPEFTDNDLHGRDTITPFKQVMKSMGVQIVQPMEFHGPGHTMNNTEDRLKELSRMYQLLEEHSDDSFLLIPGEEYNNFYGGHWSYMFPRPVYFTGWSGQGDREYRQTNVVSGGVTYPVVYQVGDASHMLRLLRDEGGIAWSSHPRIKDSQQNPDTFMHEEFYRDPSFQAGDWKAMPLDLSKDRLGFRGFQLMNDTAQLGYRKSMLGEVDTFLLDSTHEMYAHMNVNYLKLAEFPSATNWSSVVECVREGLFFTTTGEILIHSWNATRSNVTAKVEWYFPPAFAEITWGDDSGVHTLKQSLADQKEFASRQLTLSADLSHANWVRLEVWDIARNGAFTQLHWFNEPENPAKITPRVVSFTLIDSDTDAPVPGYDPIPDQAVLDRSRLPANLTIRANTLPLIVEKLTIGLNGANEPRDEWPYCLAASTVSRGLRGCPFYDYAPSSLGA